MNNSNPYEEQLTAAVKTARAELQGRLTAAQADRETALVAREHAVHATESACQQMEDAGKVLAVASRIEELAARTQFRAGNLTVFTNDSQADAKKTQVAMAGAAVAIKTATDAMVNLTGVVYPIIAIMKATDSDSAVNVQLSAVQKLVDAAMKSAEVWQMQSLQCSILAAEMQAGSVVQTYSVLGDQAVKLLTDTAQARDAARQEVARCTDERHASWSRCQSAIAACELPVQEHEGLLKSFAEIDELTQLAFKDSESKQAPKEHADLEPPSFDDMALRILEDQKQQAADALQQRNAAQVVADARALRQTSVQALLSRAEAGAASAEQSLQDGKILTQTLLNGCCQAMAVHQQAASTRDALRALYKKACNTAAQVADAAKGADDWGFSVRAQLSKNNLIPSDVVDALHHMLEKTQLAMTASVTALQTCMPAWVNAEEATVSAAAVVRESKVLLQQLLTHPKIQEGAEPVTSLSQFPLYQVSPPTLDTLVQDLETAAAKGLLHLLDALRQVREFIRIQMNDLNIKAGMELNAARHALEKAGQNYATHQAALNAASAAM